MAKITLTIDGKTVEAERGESLLEVALRHGIDIPHLCYHPAVQPYGACRMCLVQVTATSHGRKRTKLTTSCNYPALPDVEVVTQAEEIRENRQGVVERLLARAPNAARIQALAAEYGVTETPYNVTNEDCILCGLCVQVCRDIVGVEALGFIGRGDQKDVGTPFEDLSRECIGCASCLAICPFGAISLNPLRASFSTTFYEKLAEYALAARKDKSNIYLSFALNITKNCDCNGRPMKPVTGDLGILASTDPVAIDQASLDLLDQRSGKKVFSRGRHVLEYGQQIGLGSTMYQLNYKNGI